MRRREFVAVLGSAVVAWPRATHAQQRAMSISGLLSAANLNFDQFKSVRKGFNESGYIEGRNLAIINRSADSQFDRLSMLAADLVDRKVSVILAIGGCRNGARSISLDALRGRGWASRNCMATRVQPEVDSNSNLALP